MNTRQIWSLIFSVALVISVLSCSDDKDEEPACDTFSSADSVCFCTQNPDDINCVKAPTAFTIGLHTEEMVTLTPTSVNGTIWSKGFLIGSSIYLIDRESDSPHAFWKLDLEAADAWTQLAGFPGTSYGLTGSANGKGYVSSYASNKFWEYDPASNEWTPLEDLPFSPGETDWVEYKGKYYVPSHSGIYEFNPTTKEWTNFSEQTFSGFGAIFLLGDNMYWWNINNDYMSRFNLATKTYEEHDLPEGFNKSVSYNHPFVLGGVAYVIHGKTLWILNKNTNTWTQNDEIITTPGSTYADDVFVFEDKAYIVDDGYVKVFQPGD